MIRVVLTASGGFGTRMLAPTKKYEAVKEGLLEQIAELPTGTRLPSVKNIIKRYGVSQATVDRALRYLKSNGYVETIAGKGIYTSSRDISDHEFGFSGVDLILFGIDANLEKPGFHEDLVHLFSQRLGEEGIWFRSTILPRVSTVNQLVDRIESLESQALILVNLYNRDIYDAVYRRGIPFVLMFPNCSIELSNSLLIDNKQVARHWVRHLTELGHRKIAYINGISPKFYQRDKLQRHLFFYEELARTKNTADPDLVISPEDHGRDARWAVKELLRQGKDFTAIICGDIDAPSVYEVLTEEGFRIGKDISVIGVDDCPWAAKMQPPLTTVRISRDRLARLAINKLKQSFASPNRLTPVELVGSDLMVRQSTGRVN